jgi:hypothetical protein
VDRDSVLAIRELLATSVEVQRSRSFARSLRTSLREPGSLLLVGTPEDEPWHLAAHLDDEARYASVPELAPTLVRWNAPADGPAHLSVPMRRLELARRGETVLVVAKDTAPVPLLERVSDARRTGATVLALDGGDLELEGLAHDALTLAPATGRAGLLSFDTVTHLVSLAAGEAPAARRTGLRDRLARFLDMVSGPPPER